MTGNAKEAWGEVGERFSSWGRLLGERYHEMEGSGGETGHDTQRKLEEAARELTEQVNRAFTALGDTLRDERAKSHLKDAVRAIGDAVGVTVTETGEAIRRRVGSTGSEPDEEAGGGTNVA